MMISYDVFIMSSVPRASNFLCLVVVVIAILAWNVVELVLDGIGVYFPACSANKNMQGGGDNLF